jgi:hypothetical protein
MPPSWFTTSAIRFISATTVRTSTATKSYRSQATAGSATEPLLQWDGAKEQAEALVREIIEEQIERLHEEREPQLPSHRTATDETVVTNAWLIRHIYGYWPSFHDAKMSSVSLRQISVAQQWRTDMEISIHYKTSHNSSHMDQPWFGG